MDKLDSINTFISVVENGNFSKAARSLHISRDQVAKRICYLEEIFSQTFFIRNTRTMSLTSSGEKFYQHCKVIMGEFEWAKNDFINEQKYPQGELKINAPHSFSETYLTRIIADFMAQYPSIKINLFLSDNFLDIYENSYDIVLRISQDLDNVDRLLFKTYQRYFYATKTYLDEHGEPKCIEELKNHSLLLYSQPEKNSKIVLTNNKTVETLYCTPKIICNSGNFLLNFCKLNQGIIFLPDFIAADDEKNGNLVKCLEDYSSPNLYFYAITSGKQKDSKKIQFFLNYLKVHFNSE